MVLVWLYKPTNEASKPSESVSVNGVYKEKGFSSRYDFLQDDKAKNNKVSDANTVIYFFMMIIINVMKHLDPEQKFLLLDSYLSNLPQMPVDWHQNFLTLYHKWFAQDPNLSN